MHVFRVTAVGEFPKHELIGSGDLTPGIAAAVTASVAASTNEPARAGWATVAQKVEMDRDRPGLVSTSSLGNHA